MTGQNPVLVPCYICGEKPPTALGKSYLVEHGVCFTCRNWELNHPQEPQKVAPGSVYYYEEHIRSGWSRIQIPIEVIHRVSFVSYLAFSIVFLPLVVEASVTQRWTSWWMYFIFPVWMCMSYLYITKDIDM